MKKVFIAMALLVLLLALPFRSMIVEAVTASTETIEDVREGIITESSKLNGSGGMKIQDGKLFVALISDFHMSELNRLFL